MSGVEKDGGAAFPVHGGHHPDDDPRNHTLGGGLSKRDWFAGLAMAAAIGSEMHSASISKVAREKNVRPTELLATIAYEYADAMLTVRGDAP